MDKTIDQIVRGSVNNLAIIIVGVGDADFESMEILDGDEEALYSKSYRKYMSADIVQFVPFNDFKHNPHLLAKETLMEVPGQLLNYMRKKNIVPHARTEAQRQMIAQQLSMRPNAQMMAPIPKYFTDKKERFIQQCASMGLDLYQVQDFLEQRGIVEAETNIILDQMNNPNYMNVLRLVPMMAMPQ